MTTAQAVTPGQGQTVRVAGVRVGDISAVNYEDGHAVVTMDIDRKFLPIYKNATILLRPRPASRTCSSSSIPGTNYDPNSNDDEFQNGDTIPIANTAPDTNVDQILSALDGDTRAYLRLLLVGRGAGPERPRQGPRQAPRQPRSDQPRAWPGSTPRSRSARRTSPR